MSIVEHQVIHFVAPKHLDERRIGKYAVDFDTAKPFKYLELRDFLNHTTAVTLKRSLENLEFELKKSDLFEFFQTADLTNISDSLKVSSCLKISEFADFLRSSSFRAYMMAITGIDLSSSEITMFGSKYEDTHYLLPHDDQLEGRQIAFLFYFSEMNVGHGGELVLFDTQGGEVGSVQSTSAVCEAVRIRPRFNSFFFFEVSPQSLHAVSEVIGSGVRYTLAGWFVKRGSIQSGVYL